LLTRREVSPVVGAWAPQTRTSRGPGIVRHLFSMHACQAASSLTERQTVYGSPPIIVTSTNVRPSTGPSNMSFWHVLRGSQPLAALRSVREAVSPTKDGTYDRYGASFRCANVISVRSGAALEDLLVRLASAFHRARGTTFRKRSHPRALRPESVLTRVRRETVRKGVRAMLQA
jgi:hypothetical protein